LNPQLSFGCVEGVTGPEWAWQKVFENAWMSEERKSTRVASWILSSQICVDGYFENLATNNICQHQK